MRRILIVAAMMAAGGGAQAQQSASCPLPIIDLISTGGSPYYVVKLGTPDDTISAHSDQHKATARALQEQARDSTAQYRVRRSLDLRPVVCLPLAVHDTVWVTLPPDTLTADTIITPPDTVNSLVVTPANLMPIMGPMVAGGSALDQRFATYEQRAYDDALYLIGLNAAYDANHYDALIGRLAFDLRNGTNYAVHGRDVVRKYLSGYAKPNGYNLRPDKTTGISGVEALYLLDGDADALMFLRCIAGFSAGPDNFGYYKGTNIGSDPRQAAIAIQATNAAHRLGLPFGACPANVNSTPGAGLGSWIAAMRRQIGWVDQNYVDPTGRVVSRAHHDQCGQPECEAYFMNAMLATELLRAYAYVDADPKYLELAGRIMGHLVDAWQTLGGPLGYLNNRAAGSANDLASFYVWPALVIWQESGEQRFKDFALSHLQAASQAPNQNKAKQFQQIQSTLVFDAPALLAGIPWH